MFEALLAVESGQPLDHVLADFGRVSPATFAWAGARDLDLEPELILIQGGRKG